MMRYVFIALAAFAIMPVPLFANGGTFNTSAVQRTGDLIPVQKEAISLQREELKIRIEEDDAFVEVSYELLNHGPADTVMFGFPVDLATEETLHAINGYEYVLSQSFQGFRVRDNQKAVPVERVLNKPIENSDRPAGLDPKIELVRRWSLLSLHFEAGERKHLTVNYRVRCFGVDHGFEGDWDWHFGQRSFFYTFRPAATWGDGHVGELAINLDATWLSERGIPITGLPIGGKSDDHGGVRWTFRNCSLERLPDFAFRYDPAAVYRQERIAQHLIPAQALTGLTVSSALHPEGATHYSQQSMLDRDLNTSWVEGARGFGVGESIVYVPKKVNLASIGVLNGYWKKESLYYANGRIKKLRVELDVGGEVDDPNDRHQVTEVDLPDRPYRELNLRYPLNSADWVVIFFGGNGIVERVRLTILEVYPGKQFQDTAITEFYVCGSSSD